jgi:glycosyltransferase involved in cell wall biosynthesis
VDLDICLCTRDPRPEILGLAIGSLARQGVPPGTFQLLLVDNGSTPPLGEALLAPLRAAGHPARIVREERPGLTAARLRAIAQTSAPWMLFVDDDNELAEDFVAIGLEFSRSRGDLGCFGGRLLLPDSVKPPRWAEPFLPYLGIKDAGAEVLTGAADRWGPWEPPGAGFWIRRDQLEAYRALLEGDQRAFDLGRRGRAGLASCEDSLMARQSLALGLLNAYQPRLALGHHLDPARFRLGYLVRLMRGFGESQVLLEVILARQRGVGPEVPEYYRHTGHFLRRLASAVNQARKRSWRWALGTLVHQWTSWRAWRRVGAG